MKLFLPLLFLCSLAFVTSPAAEDEEVPTITIKELSAILDQDKVILLDVNGSKYFAKGHIPGALDFRAHEKDLGKVLGKDKSRPVVVYCGAPNCDAYLAGVAAAKELGFTNIRHLPAGISGWIAAGMPTGPES